MRFKFLMVTAVIINTYHPPAHPRIILPNCFIQNNYRRSNFNFNLSPDFNSFIRLHPTSLSFRSAANQPTLPWGLADERGDTHPPPDCIILQTTTTSQIDFRVTDQINRSSSGHTFRHVKTKPRSKRYIFYSFLLQDNSALEMPIKYNINIKIII